MIGNKIGAKRLIVLFTLIALSSEIVDANKDDCEIVRKLKDNSTLAEQDIYKYFCLAKLLQLTPETLAVRNKSVRWCDFDKPGGTCNVKCSSLINSDNTDNINCAAKILNSSEWINVTEYCKKKYETETRNCLDELYAFKGLLGSDDPKSDPIQPEPTSLPPVEPEALTTPASTSSTATIVTETPLIETTNNSSISTAAPTTEAISTSTTASPSTDDAKPESIFWIVSLVLFTVIVVVVAVLYRNKSRYRMFQNAPPVTDEFESSLLG